MAAAADAQGSHPTNDQVAGLIGMGYSDEQIMAADQLCLQGATDEEIWTVLGACRRRNP